MLKAFIKGNVLEKTYSSVIFTLVNLPYKFNSIDVEDIIINNVIYKCYSNHYRFDNGTMIIIKIASRDFVPYGIFARKIINFLINEFTYKIKYQEFSEKSDCRLINLGNKPVDFIEKITGRRKVGSDTRKTILRQLESILNCNMAVATGYKQSKPENDELFANEKYQFAFIEQNDEIINHKFDVFTNWQKEIYISEDLLEILSKHIMPINPEIYNNINSPMELDIYQYYSYQEYNYQNTQEINYSFEEVFKLFGRGYKKDIFGIAHFRADFRKNLEVLKLKVGLQIEASLNSKYITFIPRFKMNKILNKNEKKINKWSDIEYKIYKPILDDIYLDNDWNLFVVKYKINHFFDKSAIFIIKKYFYQDQQRTVDVIKFVFTQKPFNINAFVIKALSSEWLENQKNFEIKLKQWELLFNEDTVENQNIAKQLAHNTISYFISRYPDENFCINIITLIHHRYNQIYNKDILLEDLKGSKYQMYCRRHSELLYGVG